MRYVLPISSVLLSTLEVTTLLPVFASAFSPSAFTARISPLAPTNTIRSQAMVLANSNADADGATSASASALEKEQPSTPFELVNLRNVDEVRKQPALDGKRASEMPTSTFLVTALVGVPLFLAILPITVAYQAARSAMAPSSEDKAQAQADAEAESARVTELSAATQNFPDPSDVKPSQDRKYDVVLLGATGFTGRLAAIYIAKTYKTNSNVKWAIAGRSQSKLDKIKQEISEITNDSTIAQSLDTIIVDTAEPSTIHHLVDDTKVVLSTAGPFCKYGSNVVEFCARYGTSYVDITGETGWNKEMIMKWNDLAIQTGAKIISLCGHDSIPWDLTVFKLSQLLHQECNGDDLVSVKCFDEIKGGISGGTVDTFLQFTDGNYEEKKFDFDPYYQKRDGVISTNKTKNQSPSMISKTEISKKIFDANPSSTLSSIDGQWTVPFVMAGVNAEVVKRTRAMNENAKNPLTYEEVCLQSSFKGAFVTFFSLVIGATALLNPLTAKPVKEFVLPKPGEGPTEKTMNNGYLLLSAVGKGANGSVVESAFYFPGDAGYKETARMVAESALCLALDVDKLPIEGGGFFSPAIGMGDAILERLCKTGSKFASRVAVPSTNENGYGTMKSKL